MENTDQSQRNPRIRMAVTADVAALFKIRTSVRENHLSLEELRELGITAETLPAMLQGDGHGWVAEECGEAVAFSMVDASLATVFAMFVLPEYERRGLGRLLMQEAEHWLFSRNCKQIWLQTDKNQEVRANGFYQHLGWTCDGIQDDGQVRYTKSAPHHL
ncbi:GNAT family N-acetyltransferase [Chitinimonas sp. PSY-7]|uniref:GNAT family N-acetyltransferase n=1 Tax=Chitinimonas sp. PSY-7 TaxID=3459088 RepID=UPI00404032B6